ncbi:hypothetical protein CHH70_17355 [Shouchella clausii]|nr:hypothetical protein CHH70_17355 [Shouchella clausii]
MTCRRRGRWRLGGKNAGNITKNGTNVLKTLMFQMHISNQNISLLRVVMVQNFLEVQKERQKRFYDRLCEKGI